MGEGSGRGDEETPIVAEMTALAAHRIRGHVALIDDARLFDGMSGYPRLDTFMRWVTEQRPRTRVSVDGDIIRCVFETSD